jgi:hypothetical protein
LNACVDRDIVIGPHDPSPLPTAPSTTSELIASLSDPDYRVRLFAIYALRDMGPAAELAIPVLILTLSDDVSDIRVSSADALGEIGPKAAPAVPSLIEVLRSDDFVHARVSAAKALGKIGDISAVPALADILWDQDAQEAYISIPIKAAQAIAQLTGNQFPDSEPGPHGYRLNDDGKPLIVIAAREWWESEGQYQEWPPIGDNQ